MTDDKRVSVVANAIGFELYHSDGRMVYPHEDSDGNLIWVSKDEAALATKIAERVIRDLDEYDQTLSDAPPKVFIEPEDKPPWHRLGEE